jgi:hypothetical protein
MAPWAGTGNRPTAPPVFTTAREERAMTNTKSRRDGHETPHDAYVRAVLVRPGLVAAQVRAMLPAAVWKRLDLRRVEAVATRFIDERLSSRESDAIFQVASASGDVRVFILIEHQRTAPWNMPFRVLQYVSAFWSARQAADPGARRLPLIIPLVVSNVPGGWRGPRSLSAMLDAPPELVDQVGGFVPQLELLVDDLSALDVSDVLSRPGSAQARLAWWALSVSTNLDRLSAELPSLRATIEAVRARAPDHLEQTLVYLESLPMSTEQRHQVEAMFEVMSLKEYRRRHPELEAPMVQRWRKEGMEKGLREGMRAGLRKGLRKGIESGVRAGRRAGLEQGRQQGLQQGRQQGLQQGRQQGLQQGRQQGLQQGRHEAATRLLLALWKGRFGKAPGRTITRRIEKADLATVERWATRVLTATRVADVFG